MRIKVQEEEEEILVEAWGNEEEDQDIVVVGDAEISDPPMDTTAEQIAPPTMTTTTDDDAANVPAAGEGTTAQESKQDEEEPKNKEEASNGEDEEPIEAESSVATVSLSNVNDSFDIAAEGATPPSPPLMYLTSRMKIKVLSEDGRYRLDIGKSSMRRECPSKHDSWATRLVIRRLDEPNDLYGPICIGGGGEGEGGEQQEQQRHVVGFFSETQDKRLNIGPPAVKPCSPDHASWATELYIRRLDGDPDVDESNEPICYNEVVGVFASDHKGQPRAVRLDIGRDCVRAETPHDEETASTRLRILPV